MKPLSPLARRLVLATLEVGAIALAVLVVIEITAPDLVKPLGEFALKGLTGAFISIGDFHVSIATLAQAAVLLVALWFGTKYASKLLRSKVLDRTDLPEGLKFSVQRVAAYVCFGFGALNALQIFGVDLGNLAVFSGALGIGLGLGFQTIAKNFASGLILLFEQPVKVGDRVDLGDLQGDIISIRARGTWVRTNDNVVMIVPNSEFVEGRVTNWTANDRNVRIRMPVGVSYSSDPEHVRSILLAVAADDPDVLDEPLTDVVFLGFGDSSLDFELRVWTTRQVTTPNIIRSQLYFAIFAAFKREAVEIPFPQRDLHLRTARTALRVESPAGGGAGDRDPGGRIPGRG